MIAQQSSLPPPHQPAAYSPASTNRSSFQSDDSDPVTAYARALHEYTRKLWLEALRQEQMGKDKLGSEDGRKGQWRVRKNKA